MVPAKYNFICSQGSTFSKQITWTIDNVPVNLTSYTARMQVRQKHSSKNTNVDINTENGGISLDDKGNINLFISASETENIYAKEYVYDLELVIGSEVTRIIEGKFIVTPEVTR
jgi:hypothetical protein